MKPNYCVIHPGMSWLYQYINEVMAWTTVFKSRSRYVYSGSKKF